MPTATKAKPEAPRQPSGVLWVWRNQRRTYGGMPSIGVRSSSFVASLWTPS